MIKVLSHRGYWLDAREKNAVVAFERSAGLGFGTETDVRDRGGRLVISHDPSAEDAIDIDEMLGRFAGTGLTLAINVKADGLAEFLNQKMNAAGVPWFAFDMSGPELVRYVKAGLPCFTRHSDVEEHPICYGEAIGVWLDSFGPEWYDAEVIQGHLKAGKEVCVVSSELHGRDHAALWGMIKDAGLASHPKLFICTDLPEAARAYFS